MRNNAYSAVNRNHQLPQMWASSNVKRQILSRMRHKTRVAKRSACTYAEAAVRSALIRRSRDNHSYSISGFRSHSRLGFNNLFDFDALWTLGHSLIWNKK